MGHDHTHDEGRDHDHHHGHEHEARDPKNYLVAGWVGIAGTVFEGVPSILFSTVGGLGDALHAFTDALSFFFSSYLARKRNEGGTPGKDYEKLGVQFQTWLLIVAVVIIVASMFLGISLLEFTGPKMMIVGFIGLGFNLAQMFILGRSRRQGMNLHESVRQHAFYDVLYSCAVIHGSFLVILMESGMPIAAQAVIAVMLTLTWSVLFPSLGFVDYDGWSGERKRSYQMSTAIVCIISLTLILVGIAKLVDYSVGTFLALAMAWSVRFNRKALRLWDKGGREFAHFH